MVNCTNCGAALKEGEKFCSGCGAKIEEHEASMTRQMPAYTSQPAKKANKRLIIGIIAIIAIVIAVFLVLVIFSDGGDSRLVGTWEYEIMGQSFQYVFNSDGTLEIGFGSLGYSQEVGTWSNNGNQLCMDVLAEDIEGVGTSGEQCFTYSISSDGNTLTLTQYGTDIIFTKV